MQVPLPSRRAALGRLGRAGGAGTIGTQGRRVALGLFVAWLSARAHAGAQIEEPLADSVRSALSAAVAGDDAPPRLHFDDLRQREAHLRWRERCEARLRRHEPSAVVRRDLLDTAWYESRRAGLETALVLGLIEVESGFRKYAISAAGARGYMQVMPFWSRLIGDGHAGRLFHTRTNLRFGCTILRHYLDIERGDLFMALGRYNGTRGRRRYPDRVFLARDGWPATESFRPSAPAAAEAPRSRTSPS